MAQASPVPTQTVFGSEGATARAPIAATCWLSKIGAHLKPPSVDFHTPPEDAPAYQVSGSPGTPATAATRLPTCGPRKRKDKVPVFSAGASGLSDCARNGPAAIRAKTRPPATASAHLDFIIRPAEPLAPPDLRRLCASFATNQAGDRKIVY